MSYRNKTYVAFDGDTDIHYYRTMQMWKANDNIDFNFYDAHDLNIARDASTTESIKAQLRIRMANAKQMVLLVGENTKNLRKFVPWEIELARKHDIPILVVNLSGSIKYDPNLCPSAIKDDVYTMHVAFGSKIIKYALDDFPPKYNGARERKTKGHAWTYKSWVYEKLGYSLE